MSVVNVVVCPIGVPSKHKFDVGNQELTQPFAVPQIPPVRLGLLLVLHVAVAQPLAQTHVRVWIRLFTSKSLLITRNLLSISTVDFFQARLIADQVVHARHVLYVVQHIQLIIAGALQVELVQPSTPLQDHE